MDINNFYKELDQLFERHDTAAIEQYMVDSLETARRENDPGAITAVSNELAGFYRASGKVDDAIRLSQDVLRKLKDMGQETTENFAVALQNGANILLVAGELDTALEMFRTAEAILVYRGFGSDYRMAALCNNISALYREKEEYEQAETAALRSIEIISAMPENRIELATSLINLGEVQTRLKKFEEARNSLSRSLEIYEKETAGRDPHYAAATAAMGNLFYFWDRPSEAVPYFRKAMELIERDYGRNQFYDMMGRNLEMVLEKASRN